MADFRGADLRRSCGTRHPSSRPARTGGVVLLVEDDPGDVLLTRDAFERHHLGLQLHVVGDGDEAMRFLRNPDDFPGGLRPALVLLDLNLPGRGGLEVKRPKPENHVQPAR